MTSTVFPALRERLAAWSALGEPPTLDADRRAALHGLAGWVSERLQADEPARVVFVCTHNSRRSHLGHLWTQAAADALGLPIQGFSGGTEATAFNPRAVAALRDQGFGIERIEPGDNPVYAVRTGPDAEPVRAFSKAFGDAPNPTDGFAAVMVCTAADEACPFVPGADHRVSLPYEDPKASDGTPDEAATYRARSLEIGREMAWWVRLVRT